MTDHIEVLRGLVAEFHGNAAAARAAEKEAKTEYGEAMNLGEAYAYQSCADRLDAALAAMAAQGEAGEPVAFICGACGAAHKEMPMQAKFEAGPHRVAQAPQQPEARVIGWVEKMDASFGEIHRLYGDDGRKLVQRIPFGYPVAILPTGINNWHEQPEAQAGGEVVKATFSAVPSQPVSATTPGRLFTQYLECHITFIADRARGEQACQELSWLFSAIDGDPVLGEGVRCYATRHYNFRRHNPDAIWALMQKLRESLEKHYGFEVTRCKIELVTHDERYRQKDHN